MNALPLQECVTRHAPRGRIAAVDPSDGQVKRQSLHFWNRIVVPRLAGSSVDSRAV